MSDRGLPIVDGAPACPFVAFEDDRDGRATAPDHRHRCFAEPRPAPRALAHQEAYCLSSAFPVCPTFQDWARREAAAARPAAARADAATPDTPVSRPLPPLDRDEYGPGGTNIADGTPARRQQRDWSAPPPWTADSAASAAAAASGVSAAGAASGAGAPAWTPAPSEPEATPPEARGLAGSAAYRLASPDPADPLSPAPVRPPSETRTPPEDQPRHDRDPSGTAGGSTAAGSAAGAAAAGAAAWVSDDLDEPGWGGQDASSGQAQAPARSSSPQRQPIPDDRPPADANPRDQVSKRQPQDPSELFGPAWEKPRRYEAYPSLRTRVALPGIGGLGRVGLGALGLAAAALALFLIGPLLLGIGGSDGTKTGGTATEAPSAVVGPSASVEPTPVPAPTAQVYTVKKGDTISKIASKFHITSEELLKANPQIKDPNKISIGDPITIPAPAAAGGVEGASATP